MLYFYSLTNFSQPLALITNHQYTNYLQDKNDTDIKTI